VWNVGLIPHAFSQNLDQWQQKKQNSGLKSRHNLILGPQSRRSLYIIAIILIAILVELRA
jgi:hypothetical protein